MGEIFYTIFLPIIYPMEKLFRFFWFLTNSAGLSIILLALVISVLTMPLKRWAKQLEDKFFVMKKSVDSEVAKKAAGLKGEERFEEIEKVYQSYGYHPIKSIIASASFLVIIPFLISAIFIFSDADALKGVSFLVIQDLSVEDRLLIGFNALPILLLLLGVGEALWRWHGQQDQLIRYLIIAIVLFFLVYSLASALIIYWISMNLCAGIIYYISNT